MAVHGSNWELAAETIEEYLTTVGWCLQFRKPDGGCLGCPAALLMLCVVDALGRFLQSEEVVIDNKKVRISGGEPFFVLNHPLFGLDLTRAEIKRVEHAFRNPLSHTATIGSNSVLVAAWAGSPFDFHGKFVAIYVPELYELITKVWSKFDKSKIKNAVRKGHIR